MSGEYTHSDCAACGSLVVREKNLIQVGHRRNDPDGVEAVQVVLCDGCRFGILKELLSGKWPYSAHKVKNGNDGQPEDDTDA